MYRKRFFLFLILCLLFTGCGSKKEPSASAPEASAAEKPERDSTPVVLVPEASGKTVYENDLAAIDASHTEDGYVMVCYKGTVQNVKLLIDTPSEVTYIYTVGSGYETFPLTDGNGSYKISVWEQRPATGDYVNAISQTVEISIANEFSPYLYPNQYVNFSPGNRVVAQGEQLAAGASDDLETVSRIYDYVTTHITYDNAKAASVESGYVPDVDEILESGTGICFDYAAVMASMLRTQRIPTRLEIGYAGNVYHAWISTHIDELGWVNGIIQFDGSHWQLMDPTFAANSSSSDLKSFIGDGDNYQTKFIY